MKTGEQSLFHLPTIKSTKATVVMCDFAFQNCNTVTVTQKNRFQKLLYCYIVTLVTQKLFSETVNCYLLFVICNAWE